MDKWYLHNPGSILKNGTHKILWESRYKWITSPRRPDLVSFNKKKIFKKKRTCRIVDFTVSAKLRVKFKESEKRDKYLDFACELKKLWYLTVIPVVISAFGLEDVRTLAITQNPVEDH